ncbi:uDP-N-acetylmuramoyl-L-alanyl-D-glutamate--2 6-diaminopimelate ligase [Mycoplasma sp. CAG:877]|nr:uDP-N-acetylmuramoyl-L-alanyl-D-glutamate--2 6-diaminopimelate ligase [Mycoplasma sp. CAG:877]
MAMVNSVNIMYDAIKDKYNNMMIVPDRKLAIRSAIEMAKDRDIVLLLGKGREVYQKLEFNDIDVAYQEIVNRKIKEENS